MVEIRYGDQYEVTDLAGQTVNEAREQFKSEFGIPEKANARLNGSKVKSHAELDTVLNDDDRITFAVSRSRTPFLVGALLLALAVTGSVFAFGFINASTTLSTIAATNDFASVTTNATIPVTWSPYGYYKGSITIGTTNGTPIFNVDTATSGYAGDLVLTVSLANADTLVKCYRQLALTLTLRDSGGNLMDINESGTANASDDYVMLTLDNGSVSFFPKSPASGDNMTIRVKSGYYITHIFKAANWLTQANYQPLLFCEVAQR
jgi:molybdopterin converting factor small subunit